MNLSLLIEWLFTSLLVSLLLCLIGHFLIRSYRLKHAFYQYAFALLLILPITSLILRSQGGPSYTITDTSHHSFDTELSNSLSKTPLLPPSPAPNNRVETAASQVNESPAKATPSAAKPIKQNASSLSLGHLTLMLISAYLLGSIALFLKHYIGLRLYCRKLPELKHSLPWLKAKVLVSKDYSIPFCFGFMKPVIVLPDDINDDQDVRLCLKHENGHILNGDPQFSAIQYFVKVVFFWNPLVWILNRKFNETQEIMADHHACQWTQDPQAYASTVLNLIKRSRSMNIPALSSGMASKKQQLLVRFNAMLNQKENMHLSNPIIKKVSIGITTLLLYGAILQTGLFARDQGEFKVERLNDSEAETDSGLSVKALTTDEAVQYFVKGDNHAQRDRKNMEIIAVQTMRKDRLILESLDGKVYEVQNTKDQIKGGILRLGPDVLYCEVMLVEEHDEGGIVILGPWSNGSPMTEQGDHLQGELWEQIKAKKRELGHKQWLQYHGDKPAPN